MEPIGVWDVCVFVRLQKQQEKLLHAYIKLTDAGCYILYFADRQSSSLDKTSHLRSECWRR